MAIEVVFELNETILFTRLHDEKALKQVADKYKLPGDDPITWASELTQMYLNAEGIDKKKEGILKVGYI